MTAREILKERAEFCKSGFTDFDDETWLNQIMDSLEYYELIYELEDHLGIYIDESISTTLVTVGELISYVESLCP
jgi:acyl carrier protein